VEVNPLVVTQEKGLFALDAKINLDDSALYRHSEFALLRDAKIIHGLEQRAQEKGLSYVKLTGEIGYIVNGAGLAMATMDLIRHYGAYPANFLDIGGGASSEKVSKALDIVLSDKKVKAVTINIFGGITRCDLVSQGLVNIVSRRKIKVPLVVRISGTNEKEGHQILEKIKVNLATTMDEAVQKAVSLVRENGHPS